MIYKFCNRCEESKDINDFHYRNKAKNTRQPYCKKCMIELRVDYYKRNVNKERDYDEKRKRGLRDLVYEYLFDKKCIDCNENDSLVLQFDHVKGAKRNSISQMVMNGNSWLNILKEINKCEIRCANCHIRKTAEEYNWYVPKVL